MNTVIHLFRAFQKQPQSAKSSVSSDDSTWFSGRAGAYVGFFLAVAVCTAAAFAFTQHDVPLVLGGLASF